MAPARRARAGRAVAPKWAAMIGCLAFLATPIWAQEPLAASDWLSGSTRPPMPVTGWRPSDGVPPDALALRPKAPQHSARPQPRPAPTAGSAAAVPVGVVRLGGQNPDGGGAISARQAGLSPTLWSGTPESEAIAALATPSPRLPAARALRRRLTLAQLAPPFPDGPGANTGAFFLARVDQLLDQGALAEARALLDVAGPAEAERFRRRFDIALLAGDETEACAVMDNAPGIAPSFAARIFCLARAGDWRAAALTLTGARRLGRITGSQAELLSQFLDDGYADGADPPPPPNPLTPLDFRLYEAIGHPLASTGLPLAFAWSDLRDNNGWKARLDAGERLARASALPPAALLALQHEQRPAASGGIWARAAAMQALSAAQDSGDPARYGPALRAALPAMAQAGLLDTLADAVADQPPLADLDLEADRLDFQLRLWAGTDPGRAAPDPADQALAALASGRQPTQAALDAASAPTRQLAAALSGSAGPRNPSGAALIAAIADADAGLQDDLPRAAQGLRALRAIGLGTDARHIAVQILLAPEFGLTR